ncbi:MAG: FAD-dependent oxidoreductase [Gammaproteobacteria bacterium]|nr:FAD-dependent oxidoreductase [Gammaproteobacteria bacterium]
MMSDYSADIAIIGAGISGLWLLQRLQRLGYRVVLLERSAIGAGQTGFAQGIIHGGTKFALTGELGEAATRIAAMPARWQAALQGEGQGDGEVDLRGVKLLSQDQLLWSTTTLTSRMAGFFASRLMRSRTTALKPEAYPPLFRHHDFRGELYRLNEMVLDIASLLAVLTAPYEDQILRLDAAALMTPLAAAAGWQIAQGDLPPLQVRQLILTAGEGNADLLHQLGQRQPQMQRRPLKMVVAQPRPDAALALPTIYAHCLGVATTPRLTISTHQDAKGRPLWYLGGQLAEEGVGRSDADQCRQAAQELATLLPWLASHQLRFAALSVNRAEVAMPGGGRPDDSYLHEDHAAALMTLWPTKLALLPVLGDRVVAALADLAKAENINNAAILARWPKAVVSPLPWQRPLIWYEGVI